MANFTVVLDACVLYPANLRDLLIQLALSNLFRAKWSDEIHEEWIRNLLKNRQDLSLEQLQRTRNLMDRAVPDCLVSGYDYLVPTINLPDPNDRHVVAAAIHGRADAIVSFNKQDFPSKKLSRHGLEIIHPDDFIGFQFDLNPSAVVIAAHTTRNRLRKPQITVEQYLQMLRQISLTKTASALVTYSAVL